MLVPDPAFWSRPIPYSVIEKLRDVGDSVGTIVGVDVIVGIGVGVLVGVGAVHVSLVWESFSAGLPPMVQIDRCGLPHEFGYAFTI